MSRNLIMIKNLQENNNIESVLDATTLFLEKGYLENRKNYQINNLSKEIENFDIKQGIRLIKINKFVYDEKENILDKLSNVYTALYSSHSSLFLVLTSDGKECEFYLGVKSVENIGAAISILKSSLNGNFVGIEYNEDIDSKKIQEKMKYILRDEVLEVSTVTGIPSFKIDDKKNFLQGIEKLIEGMVGREFTTILIANPISYNHIREIKRGYENTDFTINEQHELYNPREDDNPSPIYAIVGFFIPICGFIMWCILVNAKPKTAKMAGIAGIIGFIINFIIFIYILTD